MILPSTSWEPWEPLRSRSLKYARDAAVSVSRELGFRFTPDELDASFTMHERAFLNATAIAFGISRAHVDAGIQNGEVEWSIHYKTPHSPFARCAEITVEIPLKLRGPHESFKSYECKVANFANKTL